MENIVIYYNIIFIIKNYIVAFKNYIEHYVEDTTISKFNKYIFLNPQF